MLVLIASDVRADEAPCNCSLLERDDPSPYPLAPKRYGEILADVGLTSDWNGRTDGPMNLGHARPAFTVGLTGAVAMWNQRFRIGIRAGWMFGKWGDDDRSAISFVPGMNVRLSFLMLDIWDAYGLWRVEIPAALGDRSAIGLRLGTGLGVRVARGVSVEGTLDAIAAVDHPFRNVGRADVTPGMSLSLAFDMCLLFQGFSGCHTDPPQTTHRDFTCRLYRQAAEQCPRLSRTATCAAVDEALATTPYDSHDGMAAFLESLGARVPELAGLLAEHRQLWSDAERRREEERVASQSRRQLSEHCSYAPVPVEIRRALGCDDGGCPKIACD
jgi:hypothetical protein